MITWHQHLAPGISVSCSPPPICYTDRRQIFLHLIQPSEPRSSYSSPNINSRLKHLLHWIFIVHTYDMSEPAHMLYCNVPDYVNVVVERHPEISGQKILRSSKGNFSNISIERTLQLANHLFNIIEQFADHDLQPNTLAIARVQSSISKIVH